MGRSNRHGRSGQIIVVTALLIALIITSTATYIYELSGNIGNAGSYTLNDLIESIELGSRHAIVSALANITSGRQNQTLTTDLNDWTTAVGQQYWLGKITLNYALRDASPYTSGLYISWGAVGSGVSEAYVSFQLNGSGSEIVMQRSYYVNVSSRLRVAGFMTQNTSGTKQVAVSCSLFNDGEPALAKKLAIYYRESTEWTAPNATNNYVLRDYGNGTYTAVFNVETVATWLDVSAGLFDARQIFVQANTTCLQRQQNND
jgi:hypothetical protein